MSVLSLAALLPMLGVPALVFRFRRVSACGIAAVPASEIRLCCAAGVWQHYPGHADHVF